MYNKCMYNKTYYFKHGCRTNLKTNDLEEIKNLDDKSVHQKYEPLFRRFPLLKSLVFLN
jgi:hypothetical protein